MFKGNFTSSVRKRSSKSSFASRGSGKASGQSSSPRRPFASGASNSSTNSRFSKFGKGNNGKRKFFRSNKQSNKRIDVAKFINKASGQTGEVQAFTPHHSFQDFPVHGQLKKNIAQKGYVQPTEIQDKAIPHIFEGKDVVGIANTGTGKTAAFLIPLINKVIANRQEKVLILAPTRELALQIQDEFLAFSKFLQMHSVLCIGGTGFGSQIYNLKRNPHFVIATPGRLKDLIQRKLINLANFRTVVLDEADRMLDMGFIQDIKFLLALMPKERHSLFFSATISPEIQQLIQSFLRNPVTVSVKKRDTSANVDQDIIRVQDRNNKIQVLHDLLAQKDFEKVLIFGKTKHGVEKLSILLAKRGFKVESIHGDKSQSRRQKALELFKKNVIKILVATDVAARGLDISGVSHVINYDLPATYEDYIHRIGRTGRADKFGKALTFVD